MPKLVVPHANERQKEIFKKCNITLIESLSEKEFEQEVSDYLSSHNVLHLATCRNNEPRSTPLEYYNNRLTVYIFSEGGGKFANLKENVNVCYSIADPYEPGENNFGAVGLQVWGKASTFKRNDDPERCAAIQRYSRLGDALKKQGLDQFASKVNYNVITIEPLKIRYLNLLKGFRNVLWEKE
jgi:hypothetical protein